MRRTFGRSPVIIASRVGTVSSTVMPAASKIPGSASMSPIIAGEATNRLAPTRYGIQISSIERSKATEAPWKTTSSGRIP